MWQVVRTTLYSCLLMIIGATLAGCSQTPTLATEVDDACGGYLWREKGGLIAKVQITPAGGTAFNGQLLYQVSTRRMVIQRLFDGALEQVGYSDGRLWTRGIPIDDWHSWTEMLVFASYLPVPFDLSRPGTKVRELYPMLLDGQSYRIGLINKGSDRNKWAICVNETERTPSAVIPLADKSAPNASPARGYAIRYEEISFVDGVGLPTRWTVWNWDSHNGVHEEPVATVELSEASFGGLDPSTSPQITWNLFDVAGRWWR